MKKSEVVLRLTAQPAELRILQGKFPEFSLDSESLTLRSDIINNAPHYAIGEIWKLVRGRKALLKTLGTDGKAALEIYYNNRFLELKPNALELSFLGWVPLHVYLHR